MKITRKGSRRRERGKDIPCTACRLRSTTGNACSCEIRDFSTVSSPDITDCRSATPESRPVASCRLDRPAAKRTARDPPDFAIFPTVMCHASHTTSRDLSLDKGAPMRFDSLLFETPCNAGPHLYCMQRM